MEPRGSMLYSQGLSNNPYPELNQPNYLNYGAILNGTYLILTYMNDINLIGDDIRTKEKCQ